MSLFCKIFTTFLFFSFCILCRGQSNKKGISIPNIIGMTLGEAKKILAENNVSIGAIISELNDHPLNDSLLVIRQTPESTGDPSTIKRFKKNPMIDIWITRNITYNSDSLNKSKPAKKNNDFR
jgi:PASTA domain